MELCVVHVLPTASMSTQKISLLSLPASEDQDNPPLCLSFTAALFPFILFLYIAGSLSVHAVTHPPVQIPLWIITSHPTLPPSIPPPHSLGDRMTSRELGDTVSLSQTWREREREGGEGQDRETWGPISSLHDHSSHSDDRCWQWRTGSILHLLYCIVKDVA